MPIHAIEALRRDEQKAGDGPATEAEYLTRRDGLRPLAYALLVSAFALFGLISWGLGYWS